jgi:hypothetical protein
MEIKTFKEYIALNNDDIKDLRVERANLDAAAASSAYIENLKQNFRKVQSEFEENMDLSDDNSNDLAKRLKNFNANTWVNNLYKKALEIVNKGIAIKCVVGLHNSLFPDEYKSGLTEYEEELIEKLTNNTKNK